MVQEKSLAFQKFAGCSQSLAVMATPSPLSPQKYTWLLTFDSKAVFLKME